MFDLATIQYRPDMHAGANYDVKLYSRVDGKLWYAGNGRFCPGLIEAERYARDHARAVYYLDPAN